MRNTALAALALSFIAVTIAGAQRAGTPATESPEVVLKTAINRTLIDGDLTAAVQRYREIATRYRTAAPSVAAKALIEMAASYDKLGRPEARAAYEEIVHDFAHQREAVAVARTRLGGGAVQSPGTTPPATLTTQRVLNQSGSDDRVSPDGRYIARTDHSTGNLVLHELTAGKTRPVTSDGSPEDPDHRFPVGSVFSRDGRQIAYSWYFEIKDHYVLRVIGTDEGTPKTPRTLYDNPDAYVDPMDWSPDGRWISVRITRSDRTKQIGVVRVADGSLHVLKTVDWSGIGGLRFSPDSSRLAYHRPPREGAPERDVFVIAVDASTETAIATGAGDDMVLEWTPDGQRVLIASDRGGSSSVWSVAASGQTPTSFELVKPDIGIISSLGPTRDGTLFYSMLLARPGIYTATFDTSSGQLSPGSVQALEQFRGYANFPESLDDGKSLAYLSRRDAVNLGGVITIASTDTGQARDVHPALSYGNSPRWFPDGRHLLLYGIDLKGRQGTFKIDATTGAVVLTVPRVNNPVVAADGRSFFCYDREQGQLLQRDATTGTVVRTLSLSDEPAAASPDGRYLVTRHFPGPNSAQQSALKILTLETGISRALTQVSLASLARVGNMWTIDWTPDSRSVMFYGQMNGDEGMWRVPIDGGAPQKIAVNVGPILSWRLNPKTGQVAFSTNGPGARWEMWKMENFLPARTTSR